MDTNIKRQVINDWNNVFPDFSIYSQNKLFKIVGCFLFGIELIKLPNSEEYRPHFTIYRLWKNDIKYCIHTPILIRQIYNNKKLPYNIKYANHNSFFHNASDCLREQITIPMDGSVPKKTLTDFIITLFEDILIKSNSAEQAKLFEIIFFANIYVDDIEQASLIIEKIKSMSSLWNLKILENQFGNFSLWINELENILNNKNLLIQVIEKNKEDKKMKKINSSILF